MAFGKKNKDEGSRESIDPIKGQLPMRVEIGWLEQADAKRDAIDIVKGHIDTRFTAKDAAWFRIMPFMGGYFWEAHEGGPGKSYLDAIIDELKRNPAGDYWLPSGPKKVVRILMRDGKPKPLMPNEAESLVIRNSGKAPLLTKGSMRPYARRGTGTMIFGSVMAGSSFLFMLGTMGFYLTVWQPNHSQRDVKLVDLPHSKWGEVEYTTPTEIVSKLEFNDGRWQKTTRQHMIPELEKVRQEGRETNAEFNRREFEFEKRQVGGNLTAPAADDVPNASAAAPAETLTNPAATSPAVEAATPPAADIVAPTRPVQAPTQPVPSAGNGQAEQAAPTAGQTTGDSANDERSRRVMEQIRRMREMNANRQGQAPTAQPEQPAQNGANR